MWKSKGYTTRKTGDSLEDVILGIDIGSTSTRLCLYNPTTGEEVEVDAGDVGDHSRYELGDFSTSCYPFDTGPAYIKNIVDRERLSTSLKPVFLLLTKELSNDDLLPLISEYPNSNELLTRISELHPRHNNFRRKLETAVKNFFQYLGKRTIETCKQHGFRITTVGIADPGQWPADVEDYMAEVFLANFDRGGAGCRYFPVQRDGIVFHGETQALAHYFFRHQADDPKVCKSKNGVFLLADFGGQNLNISTYQVGPGLADGKTFFEMGYSTGVAGGSELQDYIIGNHCVEVLEEQGHQLSQSDKQELINDFHTKKRTLDANHSIPKHERTSRSNVILRCDAGSTVTLSPMMMRQTFDEALRGPIQVLTKEFEKWDCSKSRRHPPRVIVAGGTARSLALQKEIATLCSRYKMGSPIFIEKLRKVARHRSFNVAKGAAYATANEMPPEDFIKRGAGIGVQTKENTDSIWFDKADFLCDAGHQATKLLKLSEGEEMKLICNPLMPPSKSPKPDAISYEDAYDVHHIGTFKEGKAEVTASFQLDGRGRNKPALVFSIRWWPKRDWARAKEPFSGSLTLPLWFHRSSSCVLVVLDGIENNLPPEALVQCDTTDEVQADVPDAQMHDPSGPSPEVSPISSTHTGIPGAEIDEHEPAAHFYPSANTQTDIPGAELYDEHGPDFQCSSPPPASIQTDIPVKEVKHEYAPPTHFSTVANPQMSIRDAKSYFGHGPLTPVSPLANMQSDPMDLDTDETRPYKGRGYMKGIRGSWHMGRTRKVQGRSENYRISKGPRPGYNKRYSAM